MRKQIETTNTHQFIWWFLSKKIIYTVEGNNDRNCPAFTSGGKGLPRPLVQSLLDLWSPKGCSYDILCHILRIKISMKSLILWICIVLLSLVDGRMSFMPADSLAASDHQCIIHLFTFLPPILTSTWTWYLIRSLRTWKCPSIEI